ncbi:hypothetical protein C3941_07415, partial [Kaistia algarum]
MGSVKRYAIRRLLPHIVERRKRFGLLQRLMSRALSAALVQAVRRTARRPLPHRPHVHFGAVASRLALWREDGRVGGFVAARMALRGE